MAVSISVIVPVYNKAKYVRECIDSLLNQTHSDFEIICVDDGSRDDSLKILNSYSDSRLKVISVSNGGVSRARNIGIGSATKEFITFVDSDDFVASDYLDCLAGVVESTGCSVVLSGLIKFTPDGADGSVTPSFAEGPMAIEQFRNAYVHEMISNAGILGYVAAKIASRSFIMDNHIRFNPALKLAEDLDFWLSVYLKINDKIGISHYAGYYYRQGADESSVNLPPQCLSQIDIWNRILSNIATTEENGREQVIRKITAYSEAHMLQLDDHSYRNIRTQLSVIYDLLTPLKLDSLACDTILQRLIVQKSSLTVFTYLIFRKFYHSLR